MTFYRLSELAGKYDRDNLSPYEIQKRKKSTLAFDGENCIINALDFLLKFKGDTRKSNNNKIVEYNLQIHAHDGSDFDNWIILNNLPSDKHIVDINKKENA